MSARQPMGLPVTAAPRRRPVRAAGLVVPAVMAAVIALGSTPVSASSPPPAPAGWTTAFSDGFSGAAGATVDSQWELDNFDGSAQGGNGSVQSYDTATANLSEDGSGHLKITPVESAGSWTSSQIATVGEFSPPAGGEMEVSASIEQPDPADGKGYWPAFWILGNDERTGSVGWPASGEIDVMESIDAENQNDNSFWSGSGTNDTSGLYSCSACDSSFNAYSVIIDRENTSDESITYYLNGSETYSVSESEVGTAQWEAAVDNNGGFFLLLDLAIGGSWPGDPTSATSTGASMSIAYVAVYTTEGSISTPTPSPTPTPTASPTATAKPTATPSPTSRPTTSASPTPSAAPTSEPATPTPRPSPTPTPTSVPTVGPTATPTSTSGPSPSASATPAKHRRTGSSPTPGGGHQQQGGATASPYPRASTAGEVVGVSERDTGASTAGNVLLATLGGSVLLLIVAIGYAFAGLGRRISLRRRSR